MVPHNKTGSAKIEFCDADPKKVVAYACELTFHNHSMLSIAAPTRVSTHLALVEVPAET